MSINWPDAGFLQMIAGGTQMLDSKLSTLSLKIQKELNGKIDLSTYLIQTNKARSEKISDLFCNRTNHA